MFDPKKSQMVISIAEAQAVQQAAQAAQQAIQQARAMTAMVNELIVCCLPFVNLMNDESIKTADPTKPLAGGASAYVLHGHLFRLVALLGAMGVTYGETPPPAPPEVA